METLILKVPILFKTTYKGLRNLQFTVDSYLILTYINAEKPANQGEIRKQNP